MSVRVLADTHALLWYLFDPDKLTPSGRAAMDQALAAGFPLLVSAISLVEIVYLEEKHRIGAGSVQRIRDVCLLDNPSIEVVPVDDDIAYCLDRVPRSEVPDMPDRIIAATALFLGIPLVTRDGKIRGADVQTIPA